MHSKRVFDTATVLDNGKVLVVGGSNLAGTIYATAELFDPATGQFALTGSLVTARIWHAATKLADGKVLITGGTSSPGHATATAEVYDPASGQFSATGSMNSTRSSHTATLLSDGKVLVAGGSGARADTGSTAEIYDPATGVFAPTGNMTVERWGHSAIRLATGTVLVIGGFNPQAQGCAPGQCATAAAEFFDPISGTFGATGTMSTGRGAHTATLLADGTVLVAGGISDTSDTEIFASAELFDPSLGVFTPTGNMETPRSDHSATLLNNGTVLIAGGGQW
jgi:hypothetical protein